MGTCDGGREWGAWTWAGSSPLPRSETGPKESLCDLFEVGFPRCLFWCHLYMTNAASAMTARAPAIAMPAIAPSGKPLASSAAASLPPAASLVALFAGMTWDDVGLVGVVVGLLDDVDELAVSVVDLDKKGLRAPASELSFAAARLPDGHEPDEQGLAVQHPRNGGSVRAHVYHRAAGSLLLPLPAPELPHSWGGMS